jgi:hypothetical protein
MEHKHTLYDHYLAFMHHSRSRVYIYASHIAEVALAATTPLETMQTNAVHITHKLSSILSQQPSVRLLHIYIQPYGGLRIAATSVACAADREPVALRSTLAVYDSVLLLLLLLV